MAEGDGKFNDGFEAGQLAQRVKNLEDNYHHLHANQDKLFLKLDELIPTVRELRVKTGLWGGAGGLLAALATLAIAIASKQF